MTTAELAILTTGVVGLGAPAIAAGAQWFLAGKTATRERRSRDLDELRELLDEITVVIHRHTKRVVAIEKWMQGSTFHLPHDEDAPDSRPTREKVELLDARLVIRRGRDDRVLVRALRKYLAVTDAALDQVERVWNEQEPFDYDDDVLTARADKYWDAYKDFVDASKGVAGSEL